MKGISFLLSVLIVLGTVVCNAETIGEAKQNSVSNDTVSVTTGDYYKYVESCKSNNADKEISVSISDFSSENATVAFENDAVNWKDGTGSVSFNVDIPDNALYSLQVVWKPVESGIDPQIGIKIDSAFPFSSAQRISLKREWKNASEAPRTDSAGNEYAQEQVETGEFITSVLQDFTGVVTVPYSFEFTKGVHTITLVNPEQPIIIKEIS